MLFLLLLLLLLLLPFFCAQAVLKEVSDSNGKIVLFIDEIHTVVGAGATGGAMDAGRDVVGHKPCPYIAQSHSSSVSSCTVAVSDPA